jgi:hypothetical protein
MDLIDFTETHVEASPIQKSIQRARNIAHLFKQRKLAQLEGRGVVTEVLATMTLVRRKIIFPNQLLKMNKKSS